MAGEPRVVGEGGAEKFIRVPYSLASKQLQKKRKKRFSVFRTFCDPLFSILVGEHGLFFTKYLHFIDLF